MDLSSATNVELLAEVNRRTRPVTLAGFSHKELLIEIERRAVEPTEAGQQFLSDLGSLMEKIASDQFMARFREARPTLLGRN